MSPLTPHRPHYVSWPHSHAFPYQQVGAWGRSQWSLPVKHYIIYTASAVLRATHIQQTLWSGQVFTLEVILAVAYPQGPRGLLRLSCLHY